MAGGGGGGGAWSRRTAARMRTLRGLVRDTQRALGDVADILSIDPEITGTVQEIGNLSSRSTALVILGTTPSAKVRLVHTLLGRLLLPETLPRGCRWVRIQYGSNTQVHLSLGNSEFELVEELVSNKKPWDTLPVEDLIRREQSDISTILEVELNNNFLKEGIKIIIPPDIDKDHHDPSSFINIKQQHPELYSKREIILKNFNPVYLFALDRIGKNVFNDNIGPKIVPSKSEEDFWSTFNLYYMISGNCDSGDRSVKSDDKRNIDDKFNNEERWETSGEPAVFTAENCLDLHQLKEINKNSQLLFVLLSNSEDIGGTDQSQLYGHEATESTESAFTNEELPESEQDVRPKQESQVTPVRNENRRLYEEQVAFMNDLLDQWELMSNPPLKHHVKSQWSILDDAEIVMTAEQKTLADFMQNAIHNANEKPPRKVGDGNKVKSSKKEKDGDKIVRNRTVFLNTVLRFASECLQSYLLEYCTRLSEVHVKLLQQFILASFDLARELQVVPKKIQYVARQEQHLYETINEKFSEGEKKRELLQIMQEVLQEMTVEVENMDWSVDDLPCHQDRRSIISNSVFYSSSRASPTALTSQPTSPDAVSPTASDPTASDGEEAVPYDSYNLDEYDIIHSNDDSLTVSECYQGRIMHQQSSLTPPYSIPVENEELSLFGSTARSVTSYTSTSCTNNVTVKHASLDVQQTVLSKLSRKISLKLVKFVDCLRDNYFGTLQRCLDSLESSCRQELGGRPASEAMRQLLSVARQVELRPCASFSLLRSLVESLRRLLSKLRLSGGEAEDACCVLSPVWRRRVALHTVQSLSVHKLARVISTQILERLSTAHERYQSALTSLESALADRLHHTEDVKLTIRKKYAPAFARLCLESTSMCDLLMYGMPELGREIGRGQYGVVYSVRGSWAGKSPVAVKSVLPADERHYHELAMEFFYTRSIPEHPRIVRLVGSVVRGAGTARSVLLVSERRARDLHTAVRAPLAFAKRMRISCDIVEGIRYLHSLGLVHRDIKMKNVLLDNNDRASLSDLGFCAAEALMSGSVVGTPVHMAPELLQGEYDAAVDVYAFGILFWYVCAGNVKLPTAFEVFQNKEQLWSKVKRGLRPERLPHFTDECWDIMESCWHSEPAQRALLGDVQLKLEQILANSTREEIQNKTELDLDYVSDEDSLEMTGVDRNGL